MPDQVPDDVKHERLERLVDVVQRVAAERNAERVGRVEEVLVEGPSRTDAVAPARPDAPQHHRELRRRDRRRASSSTSSIESSTSTTLRGREAGARRCLTPRDCTLSARVVTHPYEFRLMLAVGGGPGCPTGHAAERPRCSRSSGRPPPASPPSPRQLADTLGTEVVSADALQVYRGLPILTNQPETPDAARRYPRRSPRRCRSASTRGSRTPRSTSSSPRTAPRSSRAAPASTSAQRSPTCAAAGARARRAARAGSAAYDADPDAAHARLADARPAAAAVVHPNDRRRVVRALELAELGASLVPRGRPALVRRDAAPDARRRASRSRRSARAAGSWPAPRRCSSAAWSRRPAPRRDARRLPHGRASARSARAGDAAARRGPRRGSSCGRAATPRTSGSGCAESRASS